MIGYIFEVDTGRIVTKVENVKACNDTIIKGDSLAVVGTGQYIVTDKEFAEGDALPNDIQDMREGIPLYIAY